MARLNSRYFDDEDEDYFGGPVAFDPLTPDQLYETRAIEQGVVQPGPVSIDDIVNAQLAGQRERAESMGIDPSDPYGSGAPPVDDYPPAQVGELGGERVPRMSPGELAMQDPGFRAIVAGADTGGPYVRHAPDGTRSYDTREEYARNERPPPSRPSADQKSHEIFGKAWGALTNEERAVVEPRYKTFGRAAKPAMTAYQRESLDLRREQLDGKKRKGGGGRRAPDASTTEGLTDAANEFFGGADKVPSNWKLRIGQIGALPSKDRGRAVIAAAKDLDTLGAREATQGARETRLGTQKRRITKQERDQRSREAREYGKDASVDLEVLKLSKDFLTENLEDDIEGVGIGGFVPQKGVEYLGSQRAKRNRQLMGLLREKWSRFQSGAAIADHETINFAMQTGTDPGASDEAVRQAMATIRELAQRNARAKASGRWSAASGVARQMGYNLGDDPDPADDEEIDVDVETSAPVAALPSPDDEDSEDEFDRAMGLK